MSFKGGKKSNVYPSKTGYDMYAKYYNATADFLNSFERDELKKLFGKIKGKNVLDAGCGTGRLFPELFKAEKDVTGIDVSGKMIEFAEKKFPKAACVVGDIEKMPFKDNSFDIVVSTFVIVHLKTLEKFFGEVYRVLKDGGIFILTNINQRKAPKLIIDDRAEIVIKSFYHMPKEVLSALDSELFVVDEEKFLYEGEIWINQIIVARK